MVEESSLTQAIILNRHLHKEVDASLVVFARSFGKLNLIARGMQRASSKLAGHLEPLNLAELLLIKGKSQNYIGSALTSNSFYNLKQDLNKLYFAGQAIFLFNYLVKNDQEDNGLFDLLQSFLESLDAQTGEISKEQGILYYNFFALKLLIELGSGPEMYNCLAGGEKIEPGDNYFDLRRGGLNCVDCDNRKQENLVRAKNPELLKLTDNTIKLFRLAASLDFNKITNLSISKANLKEFQLIIKSFLQFQYNFSRS